MSSAAVVATLRGDARPEQLIKAARDANLPEDEIRAAIDLAEPRAFVMAENR
jgi:hypothetical protein